MLLSACLDSIPHWLSTYSGNPGHCAVCSESVVRLCFAPLHDRIDRLVPVPYVCGSNVSSDAGLETLALMAPRRRSHVRRSCGTGEADNLRPLPCRWNWPCPVACLDRTEDGHTQ